MKASPIPPAYHVLIKPTGAVCNLACDYCFFLSKDRLYPGSGFRMTEDILAEFIRQFLASQQIHQATIAWQGGEPTLMGLDFFRRSIELVEIYRPRDMRLSYTVQTNGTTLDDRWCELFKQHDFLFGLSLDSPEALHNVNRRDRNGGPTFDRVMEGVRRLQANQVDFNFLATVHAANADHSTEVYRFFRDEVDARHIL